MARRAAKIDGLIHVECIWDEVFTGIEQPRTLTKGEKKHLPFDVARLLVGAGAARNV